MEAMLVALTGVAGAIAAVLLWGFVHTRVLIRRAERRFPRLGMLLPVEGQRVHVRVLGEGPPLVLVHGAFGGMEDFLATIVPTLARTHRVILVDRPGHGYSGRDTRQVMTPDRQAAVVRAAVRQVAPGPVTLVGFSWGGALALAYALAYPREVRALVVLNGATHAWPTGLSPVYAWSLLPFIGTVFRHTLLMPLASLAAARDVSNVFHPEPVPPAFAHSPVALSIRPAAFRANAEDMVCLKSFLRAQSQRHGELEMPVVIVVGSGDRVVDPAVHGGALHRQVPGSHFTRLENAGHQILYSRTADALAAVERAEAMASAAQAHLPAVAD